MKNACYWGVSALIVMAGCVPSLHELYTEQTLIFDPAIAGRWQQEDDPAVWVFTADEEHKVYGLTIFEKDDKQSRLTARLTDIDGKRFFDFYPDGDGIEAGDWVKIHLVPAHLFLHVEQTEPNLVLAVMNPETVGKLIKEKPELVPHERIKDGVVLTGKPAALQTFVTAGLEIEEFFSKPITLHRIAATDEKPD